jgi:hypothetical protein
VPAFLESLVNGELFLEDLFDLGRERKQSAFAVFRRARVE